MTQQARKPSRPLYAGIPEAASVERLIEQASDIAVLIDKDDKVRAISVNPESPSLGCLDHWTGREFRSFLTEDSRAKFARRMEQVRADPESFPRPIELNHVDNASWEFPVRYTLHRDDNEGGGFLLLGRDMQPLAEIQQRLVREQVARDRDQEKFRGIETFYRAVLEASQTPLVLVEAETGRVRDINSAAADILGAAREDLTGSAFAQMFEGQRRGAFLDTLKSAAVSEGGAPLQTVVRRNGRVVQMVPEFFRASGEVIVLCRMHAAAEEESARPEMATLALNTLFDATSDAIVLTDPAGVIIEANEGFLVLSDAALLRDIQGRSISDFLSRGSVDLKLILENTRKTGRMRGYSAQIQSMVGTRAAVDISSARLRRDGSDLGVGMIIRDVSPRDPAVPEARGAAMSEDAMKNVMDLVGTATLKELVSATSDVVEKMCIETAVRLTNNNRVAAAEMLGLSRQSLYVKLRKYDLLHSTGND